MFCLDNDAGYGHWDIAFFSYYRPLQDHDVDHAVKHGNFLAKPTRIIVRALSLQA